MLVPFADDAYHRARPTIGHPADKVLKLDDYCGLHPALGPHVPGEDQREGRQENGEADDVVTAHGGEG